MAPLGSRFMRISAFAVRSASATFASGVLLGWMMFSALLPMPSSVGALLTVTPVCGMSVILGVLLGGANMASARSFPTFRLSTSNAATTFMSLGVKPPSLGLRSPTGFSVNML